MTDFCGRIFADGGAYHWQHAGPACQLLALRARDSALRRLSPWGGHHRECAVRFICCPTIFLNTDKKTKHLKYLRNLLISCPFADLILASLSRQRLPIRMVRTGAPI